jgi:hypothetical protein
MACGPVMEMMMGNPIRVAASALSGRIFAGRPTKDGLGFKEPRYDVTSDVLCAVKDKIGIGHEVTVESGGIPQFHIAILPIKDTPA